MNNPETHSCCTCGYTWSHGQHGGHSCADNLLKRLEDLQQQVEALAANRDSERLDFMLQKARKVTAANILYISGWELAVRVQEGVMCDVNYPAIKFTGEWTSGSTEVLTAQRQAIDAAMAIHKNGGAQA